jgi:hypothetical protein
MENTRALILPDTLRRNRRASDFRVTQEKTLCLRNFQKHAPITQGDSRDLLNTIQIEPRGKNHRFIVSAKNGGMVTSLGCE